MSAPTRQQKKALKEILRRVKDGVRYTCLRGYAGTGKTFLMRRLVDELDLLGIKVAACAPTHKAARVLGDQLAGNDVRAQTIHSFLGLRLKPDGRGSYRLEPEPGHEMPEVAVVIVDEASMIGLEEWTHIEQAWDQQFIFVGDPAQLPPVNEGSSPVFELEGPCLEDVVRQARDNPIITLATQLRSEVEVRYESAFDGRHGVGVTRNRQAFLDSAMRAFKDERFHDDANHARILAYRNRTVRDYNRYIRGQLFPDANARFVEDEWLVARETWYDGEMPIIINSEEVRVIDAVEDEAQDARGESWRVWRLTVDSVGFQEWREIEVLHETELGRFERELSKIKRDAIRGEGDWREFYGLRERFADVDYAYASTIHKAQGSTYHTAFVDVRDAHACRGSEKRALLYVAVTRPSERLALLT